MARDFNEIIYKNRVQQQGIVPTAIKTRQVDNDLIQNSDLSTGTLSIADGVTVSIHSTISSSANPATRLSTLPFQVAFFEGTTPTASKWIPFGSGIATSRYTVTNLALPSSIEITLPGGFLIENTGNNVVWSTSIANHSGSTQTILYYIQARVITGVGGGVA